MIVGICIPYLHNFFIKNNITIKMPETVPPMISESFASMIPMLLAPIVTFLLGYAAMAIGLVPYMNGVGVSLGTPHPALRLHGLR